MMRVAVWVADKVKTSTRSTISGQALSRERGEGYGTRQRRRGMDITWLTERISVGGGIWSAENMAQVAEAGITHIIDMQIEFDDTPLALAHGIEVLWNPTNDDFETKPAALFRRGVEFAEAALENDDAKIF